MAETLEHRRLVLASLKDGMPGLTLFSGGVMAEAASVCLEDQGHGIVTSLGVEGHLKEVVQVEREATSTQMKNSHRDAERATENGAYGVAILTVNALTGLTVLKQSTRRTGVDYWLAPQGARFFQTATRLEVSGIRRGDESTLQARVRQKVVQVERWRRDRNPALIAVVEFSRPVLRIVKA
jgi:hypothetical protein